MHDDHDAHRASPDDLSALASAAEVVEQSYVTVMRHEPQLRRFARALEDLRLPVPRTWARFEDENTVSFTSITAAQFRRLINVLEHIADTHPAPPVSGPGPNDVPLFEVVTAITANQHTNTSNAGTAGSGGTAVSDTGAD